MSTIASPRDPSSLPLRRGPPTLTSPTPSTRPSLDIPRSGTSSPNPSIDHSSPSSSTSAFHASTNSGGPKRNNRAALREYYNLRRVAATPPPINVSAVLDNQNHNAPPTPGTSEVPWGELDVPHFDGEEYVRRVLAESGLDELLRLYARVLGEVRALDAEKKALVYDNYSKLIAATETIRKMRSNMDPLNPMTTMLDPQIAQIYAQASSARASLRASLPSSTPAEGTAARQRRTRELATEVLGFPDKLRRLVAENRLDQARAAWVTPRRLLLVWKEKGLGGEDVVRCLREGDSILAGAEEESDGSEESKGGSR